MSCKQCGHDHPPRMRCESAAALRGFSGAPAPAEEDRPRPKLAVDNLRYLKPRAPRGKQRAEERVDMAALEVSFKSGRFKTDELCRTYNVCKSTLARLAKEHGWKRAELAPAVKAVTASRLMDAAVEATGMGEFMAAEQAPLPPGATAAEAEAHHAAAEAAAQQRMVIQVSAAAEVNKAVVLEHRCDISRLRNIVDGMMGELEVGAGVATVPELKDLLEQARAADPNLATKLAAVASFHARTLSAQRLSSTLFRLQHLQRVALQMDDPEWQRPDELSDLSDDELDRAIAAEEEKLARRTTGPSAHTGTHGRDR